MFCIPQHIAPFYTKHSPPGSAGTSSSPHALGPPPAIMPGFCPPTVLTHRAPGTDTCSSDQSFYYQQLGPRWTLPFSAAFVRQGFFFLSFSFYFLLLLDFPFPCIPFIGASCATSPLASLHVSGISVPENASLPCLDIFPKAQCKGKTLHTICTPHDTNHTSLRAKSVFWKVVAHNNCLDHTSLSI